MALIKLQVNYRTDMSKGRKTTLRREGCATASVCGRNVEPVSVEVQLSELYGHIKNSEDGVKSLFDLDIVGAAKEVSGAVMIKEIYKDPVTRQVMDITFQRVSMSEKNHVGVPIEMVGKPAALIAAGGRLEQVMDELQVMCTAADTPHKLVADVSGLGIGDHLRVSDIVLPAGVEAIGPQDAPVVVSKAPSTRQDKTAKDEE